MQFRSGVDNLKKNFRYFLISLYIWSISYKKIFEEYLSCREIEQKNKKLIFLPFKRWQLIFWRKKIWIIYLYIVGMYILLHLKNFCIFFYMLSTVSAISHWTQLQLFNKIHFSAINFQTKRHLFCIVTYCVGHCQLT